MKNKKINRKKQVFIYKSILTVLGIILLYTITLFLFSQPEMKYQNAPAVMAPPNNHLEQAAKPAAPPKYIAFSFDDGPGPYTDWLLDELKERNVKATFFFVGKQVEKYPATVKRISEEGHELGNHTYSHSILGKSKKKQIKKEINKATDAIKEATGGKLPTLFRPPGGSHSKKVLEVCKDNNLPVTLWSVDTMDWKSKNEKKILKKAFQDGDHGIRDGSIVLLHDIHKTSVTAALTMADRLLDENYQFVTISELLALYKGKADPGDIYYSNYPPEDRSN